MIKKEDMIKKYQDSVIIDDEDIDTIVLYIDTIIEKKYYSTLFIAEKKYNKKGESKTTYSTVEDPVFEELFKDLGREFIYFDENILRKFILKYISSSLKKGEIISEIKEKIIADALVENDLEITEADVRELKTETNRFKVAMLLQAKSRLSMVLKLCDTLDKLYAELVVRINQSLTTTDTSSLMFTADYISKALADTNQFIMSLITNEKIQNFFIIDNSNVINITENRVDIDKREKIRKAAEIVIENVDYFSNGEYDKMVNPNAIEVEPTPQEKEGEENANSTTKSVSS